MNRGAVIFVLALSALIMACTKTESIVDSGPGGTPFPVDAVDYATNYFFIDTAYISTFYEYLGSTDPVTLYSRGISLESIWVERLPGEAHDPNEIPGKAVFSLPYWRPGAYDNIRSSLEKPGEVESGSFVRLSPDMYSLPMAGVPGIVALRTPISDARAIAISCMTNNGFIGEFPWGVPFDSTLNSRPTVFKLLRPRNLMATGRPQAAWTMLLKNVYRTGLRKIDPHNFRVNITYNRPGVPQTDAIFGQTILRILGLDKLDKYGQWIADGDGTFDFVIGKTIDPEYGEIILPHSRPFDGGIQAGLAGFGTNLPSTSPYRLAAVYDSTQSIASATSRGVYTITATAVLDLVPK